MKKTYEIPEAELLAFAAEDVILTSGIDDTASGGEILDPEDPNLQV